MAIRIKVRDNGPYKVEAPEGGVTLVDADGREYDVSGQENFVLCRCGASQKKPFCDRSHSRVGFQSAEKAAKMADEQGASQSK